MSMRSILDRDRGFALFRAGEREMEDGVEPARLVRLEDIRHEVEQAGNRVAACRPLATGFTVLFLNFCRATASASEPAHDIDRLGALLQRPHHLLQVPLLVVQIGADDVFAGRTYRHAVGRLVVGAVAQALPHRCRLGLADAPAIVEGVARVGDLLDPIGEAAQELAIIVGEAGGEIERAVRADGADRTGGDAELAFEARVVVDRMVVIASTSTIDQHGAQAARSCRISGGSGCGECPCGRARPRRRRACARRPTAACPGV